MNKPKAFSILCTLEQEWQSDDIKTMACIDCRYMIELGWIYYSKQIEKVLLEGFLPDTIECVQYQKAIAEIHQKLIDNNVFK